MPTSLPLLVALGFFLGMRHATDPDHVIAVSTILSRHRSWRRAALVGAAWGLGHTATIVVVGGGIIMLGWVIPARVGLSLEFSVGIMLVLLGVLALRGSGGRVEEAAAAAGVEEGEGHSHPHRHGDYIHTHPHRHRPGGHPHAPDQTPLARLDRRLGALRPYQVMRPFVIGTVHGLAGSAAVALLVLTAIGDSAWAMAYLVLFGLGTVAGMMLVTALLAWPFAYAAGRATRVQRGLRLATGVISVVFGLALAYRVGMVDGLFGASPSWTPR
jgi:high-affinity nickel-transport protein